MDHLSVLRHDTQRISSRCDLFAFLFVACLACGQFLPCAPNNVPLVTSLTAVDLLNNDILYRAPMFSNS